MRTLVVLALLAPALAAATPLVPAAACAGLVDVPGQGPSCPVPGGWEVLLPDGGRLFTHGPEELLANGNPLPLTNPPPAAPVACVTTVVQHSLRVLYVRPFDKPDQSAAKIPQIRALVEQANGLLRAEAAAYGEIADLRVYCDASGAISVNAVPLPTASASDSFSTIVGDLRKIGYNGNTQKYWVFYDDTVACACAGQANLFADDRLVLDNKNNGPPGGSMTTTFGISYGVLDAGVAFHEILHTMGAVQRSAPHSTSANHCTDGLDVLCYADGGAYDPGVCTDRTHLDCNGDDYFHPNAPPGSYLGTRWNLGSHLVRFMRFGTETAPPTVAFVTPQLGQLHTGCAPGTPYVVGRAALKTTGCVELTLADATGIGRVEVYVNGVLVGSDASGATSVAFPFAITATRTGAPIKVDVYDTRGNYGSVTRNVDLLI